ncbi:MAG TPA: hypothetical protein VMI94_01905 [Bryobacteraceae bacterium]|nr:hypothetical protein [Bryobacteraceae bacterium]
MKQLMKCVLWLSIIGLYGCSKSLTESSAVSIIQKYVDAQNGGVISTFAGNLTSQIGVEMPQHWTVAAVQRALRSGYVQEKTMSVSYPNFSGAFTGSRGFQPGQQYGGWNDFFNVSTSPGRPPYVNGSIRSCYAYDPKLFFQHDSCWSGTVAGPVRRNGVSNLLIRVTAWAGSIGMMPNTTMPLNVSLIRGSPDIIQGSFHTPRTLLDNGSDEPVTFRGRVTGADIQQEVYVYAWTDKLPKEAVSGAMLKLGHLEVDSCERLLLASETTATASCKTHVKLTTAAEAIFGQRPTDESVQVSFGKQPNGNWVCTNINYSPPPYNIFQ